MTNYYFGEAGLALSAVVLLSSYYLINEQAEKLYKIKCEKKRKLKSQRQKICAELCGIGGLIGLLFALTRLYFWFDAAFENSAAFRDSKNSLSSFDAAAVFVLTLSAIFSWKALTIKSAIAIVEAYPKGWPLPPLCTVIGSRFDRIFGCRKCQKKRALAIKLESLCNTCEKKRPVDAP